MKMAKGYRPLLGWENDMRVNVPSCTIVEGEMVTKFSGLLDAYGNKLMVMIKSESAGFVVFPERNSVPSPPAPTTLQKGGMPRFGGKR
jgi:hypothetical protein